MRSVIVITRFVALVITYLPRLGGEISDLTSGILIIYTNANVPIGA